MARFLGFYWLCTKEAWRGSIEKANAWAAILGAFIIWFGLRLRGYELMLPETFFEGIVVVVICLAAAWIALFVVRFLAAQARLYWCERDRADELDQELREIRDGTPPPFEFVYSPNDARYVEQDAVKTRYFVGLHVISTSTVDFPSVRAIKGTFTDRFIAPYHPTNGRPNQLRAVVIYEGGAIDPDVTEPIHLCDLPPYEYLPGGDRTPLGGGTQKFTLEARCRHARPCFAEFEFDPTKIPMIRLLT